MIGTCKSAKKGTVPWKRRTEDQGTRGSVLSDYRKVQRIKASFRSTQGLSIQKQLKLTSRASQPCQKRWRSQENKQAVPLKPPRCTLRGRLQSHPRLGTKSTWKGIWEKNAGHYNSALWPHPLSPDSEPLSPTPKWTTLAGKKSF